MSGAFGAIIQMLILTAQRRNEVSEMTWSELDLDNNQWEIPSARTKNEKPHFVHLSEPAIAVISVVPNIGDYVFTSNGKTPFSGFSKSKKRLDELSGVSGWRLHDIRRTVGTNLAELEVPRLTISRILNHKEGGVTSIYDRHSYFKEKLAALELWGRRLDQILTPDGGENVVPLPTRAR